jgi:hypothetical protein
MCKRTAWKGFKSIGEDISMWTKFFDMSSGGSTKVKLDGRYKEHIYIELPEDEAINYFEERFNRHPYNVTCDCCGEDYSISSAETLEEITMYNRNAWTMDGNKFQLDVEDYVKRGDVMVIYSKDIQQVLKYPSLENKK